MDKVFLHIDLEVQLAIEPRQRRVWGFMLTHRGIKANPDKCQAIINMISPQNVKEMQRLTGWLAPSKTKGHDLCLYLAVYEHTISVVILQKLELAEKIIAWSVKLFEFSLKYESRCVIKSQAIANFIVEMV
ncbi:hypothetical protein CR513_16650, partial [Mucuna pruriens]